MRTKNLALLTAFGITAAVLAGMAAKLHSNVDLVQVFTATSQAQASPTAAAVNTNSR